MSSRLLHGFPSAQAKIDSEPHRLGVIRTQKAHLDGVRAGYGNDRIGAPPEVVNKSVEQFGAVYPNLCHHLLVGGIASDAHRPWSCSCYSEREPHHALFGIRPAATAIVAAPARA